MPWENWPTEVTIQSWKTSSPGMGMCGYWLCLHLIACITCIICYCDSMESIATQYLLNSKSFRKGDKML